MHFNTRYASNELAYEFKINDVVDLLVDLFSKNYDRLKLIKCEDVEAIMTFANAISKIRYDQAHRAMRERITLEFIIYLRLHQDYTISSLTNKKLSN